MIRRGYLIMTGVAVVVIGIALDPIAPRLMWNASASAPIGLYVLYPTRSPALADLIAIAVPEALTVFMAERGYLPRGIPLLKHVAGVAGQRICRVGTRVTVDGVELGEALARDRLGRDLPVWHGCRRIADGEIFVMNAGVRDSFDGRYFGPLPASALIGRAQPLWIADDRDRFEWRTHMR